MTDQTSPLSLRPYGDRWAIVSGGEVVLVSETLESARAVIATATDVLEQSGLAGERRSFKAED